jgi:hypothetical protein
LKLKTVLELQNILGVVGKPLMNQINKVYVTIFKVKEWKILIFEWILLLEIQTICKTWVWKEKLVEPSKCLHIAEFINSLL